MFNWLGNLFPYSDLHSLNLDWLLSKMKETAAQAAQAIADSAKALAQVIEAKTAAQNAQTAAQNAQTAANNAQTAANNAADSAENAVTVAQSAQSAAQTAQNTANTAQSAAQSAQTAAQSAQTAAQNAQNTAETAQSAAETAQTAAENAQETATTALSKFPVKSFDLYDRLALYTSFQLASTGEGTCTSTNTDVSLQNYTGNTSAYGIGVLNIKFSSSQSALKIINGVIVLSPIMRTSLTGYYPFSILNITNGETTDYLIYVSISTSQPSNYCKVYKKSNYSATENLEAEISIQAKKYGISPSSTMIIP